MAAQKVVAVTGASRGIGSCIAEALAQRGHVVGCLSRGGQGPEDRRVYGDLVNLTCDITDDGQIRDALAALVQKAGRLDGLVNNAGLYLDGPAQDFATEDFEQVLRTNVTGSFVACREAHPHLVANGGGVIINIGSFYEQLGVRLTAAYSASKAAIGALTRSLAVEWAGDNIRVLDVAPGFIATELNAGYMQQETFRRFLQRRIPTGGPGQPEEVGRLVALLIDAELPFLTGETIVMDGGQGINQ